MRRLHTTPRAPRVTRGRRTRRATGALLVAVAAILALPFFGSSAGAQDAPEADRSGIDVVQGQGLPHPPNAALIERSIERAERGRSMLLVFQLNSSGAVDVDVDHLVDLVRGARVPVAVWVGPS